MEFHQGKKLRTAKETISRMKSELTEQKEIFINHISDKGLISIIY